MSTHILLDEPTLYQRLHTGNAGDEAFYARACEGAERVLELGAGWGRLSLPLARAGHHVVGIEREARFVARAREEATELTPACSGSLRFEEQDLFEFESAERFDRVLIPYNTLYSLGGREGTRRAFQIAERHLDRDGELWFDVYAMDGFDEAARAGEIPVDEEEPEEVSRFFERGKEIVVFEATRIELGERRLEVSYAARLTSGDLIGSGSLIHHYLLIDEILEDLAGAGLTPVLVAGGFAGEPHDEEAEHIVICATRTD